MAQNKEERKLVLASGVFDLLHLGHVRFLEEAKKAGGPRSKLVVIVARDSTVEKRKGERPVMSENQRCALVASLKVVDEATLGLEKFNIAEVIDKLKPDVIAFGYDQKVMMQEVKDYVKEHGRTIRVVKVGKFSADELDSSSKIKHRILEDLKR
jgi:FAD synthetase